MYKAVNFYRESVLSEDVKAQNCAQDIDPKTEQPDQQHRVQPVDVTQDDHLDKPQRPTRGLGTKERKSMEENEKKNYLGEIKLERKEEIAKKWDLIQIFNQIIDKNSEIWKERK
jgi:hypothetical protein